jgi:hypothetical protein
MPWGDGIVDVQNLIILSEHLFEEIVPPELVASWKFDETEGSVAYEAVSSNYGYLFGDPLWHPTEGKKDGRYVAGATAIRSRRSIGRPCLPRTAAWICGIFHRMHARDRSMPRPSTSLTGFEFVIPGKFHVN